MLWDDQSSFVRFGVLGPLEVLARGRRLSLGGPKQQTLLAVLLLNANRVVAVDRLTYAMWDHAPPSTATAQIHQYISSLRRILDQGSLSDIGRRIVLTRTPGYALHVEHDQLDLFEFDRRVLEARAECDAGHPHAAAEQWRAALTLWRGPALGGAVGDLVAAEAARLEERRLAALEERIDIDLALGRCADLIAELTVLVAEHPLRDRLRGQLMLALYRSGRQAEALAVYRRGRDLLIEQLGLDPGPQLRQLEHKILIRDPSLLFTDYTCVDRESDTYA